MEWLKNISNEIGDIFDECQESATTTNYDISNLLGLSIEDRENKGKNNRGFEVIVREGSKKTKSWGTFLEQKERKNRGRAQNRKWEQDSELNRLLIYAVLNFDMRNKTEQDCLNLLKEVRWPNHIRSPFTNTLCVYKSSLNRYKDAIGNRYFSETTNTIFSKTKLPLTKLFYIIQNMPKHPGTIIAKNIGVRQQIVSRWISKFRDAIDQRVFLRLKYEEQQKRKEKSLVRVSHNLTNTVHNEAVLLKWHIIERENESYLII